MRGLVGLCVALACAGCSDDPAESADPSGSPSVVESPTPTEAAAPAPSETTTELRYRVKPRNDGLLSIRLPPQKPGGTMVTWSAYLVGVGKGASPAYPRKVECYVVQATGPDFEDRVLYVADDSTSSLGTDVSMSGSGLVDTEDGRVLLLECELDDNDPTTIPGLEWRTSPQEPIQVTLTPVELRAARGHGQVDRAGSRQKSLPEGSWKKRHGSSPHSGWWTLAPPRSRMPASIASWSSPTSSRRSRWRRFLVPAAFGSGSSQSASTAPRRTGGGGGSRRPGRSSR